MFVGKYYSMMWSYKLLGQIIDYIPWETKRNSNMFWEAYDTKE